MRVRGWLVFLLLLGVCGGARAQGPVETPYVEGYVTDAGTPTAFRVDAAPVACTPGVTESAVVEHAQTRIRKECVQRRLGEPVAVFGTKRRKDGVIEATKVQTALPAPVPVEGYGLIDRVLPARSGDLAAFRADGYPLSVMAETKVSFAPGSALTLATMGPNVWVRYAGSLRLDGTVAAKSVQFSPNVVKDSEDRLRQDTDFDPAAVTEDDKPGPVIRFLNGTKASELPAYKDASMQERLERIGTALIPAYQKKLPEGDPTKIHFRFQMIDEKYRRPFGQPSGVIQMPADVMLTLVDDAQVAAVLSAAISDVILKQWYRERPGDEKRGAVYVAGLAAGVLVPGVGLATQIGTAKAASIAEHHWMEQSTRNGLAWMEDAGFDVRAAPVAWWLLAGKKGKELSRVELPYRTQYLYGLLYREEMGAAVPERGEVAAAGLGSR